MQVRRTAGDLIEIGMPEPHALSHDDVMQWPAYMGQGATRLCALDEGLLLGVTQGSLHRPTRIAAEQPSCLVNLCFVVDGKLGAEPEAPLPALRGGAGAAFAWLLPQTSWTTELSQCHRLAAVDLSVSREFVLGWAESWQLSLPDAWRRHILDSAQLWRLVEAPDTKVWMDMGAGAGFPGLVMAIMGARHVHLVESIAKKCRFLEAVVEALGLAERVTVHNARLEALPRFKVDILTARALAKVTQLFDWGHPFAASSSRWILPKGQDVEAELAEASAAWRFQHQLHASLSDPRGRIIEAWDVQRKAKR